MDDLVGTAEVAKLLGDVSRQRVHQLIRTYADFPEPAATLARGRVWRRQDVERWIAAHPDRTPATRVRPRP